MRCTSLRLFIWGVVAAMLVAKSSAAATIQVGPTDTYAKIEGAKAGDEVVIAPGTYKFRVYLTEAAPASMPIIIRAEDPMNPPVWDLTGTLVEDAPGSYMAGDRGRGCWQISGGTNYQISGLVIKGCSAADFDSAGLRYYNGASGNVLRDVVFQDNDNGLTGGSQNSDITVEFCEFNHNGNLMASSGSPSHNIYVYGGTFALRYSYVHDPAQAQNFHIRATNATLEYNWFARAKSYEGDLMTDDDFSTESVVPQSMLLRGNVIVQAAQPNNDGQVVAVYNDEAAAGASMSVVLVNNTFIGNGGHAALVHLSNADGTTMSAELDNNVIYGTSIATLVETAADGTVTGKNNWMATGGNATGLSNTVFAASPMFGNAASMDFTLGAGSSCRAAAGVVMNLPSKEYFQNETNARMYRLRSSVKDIGAFESSTTGPGIGPYGSSPTGDAGVGADAGELLPDAGTPTLDAMAPAAVDGGTTGGGTVGSVANGPDAGPTTMSSASSGCGCHASGSRSNPGVLVAIAGLAAALVRRRRPSNGGDPSTPPARV